MKINVFILFLKNLVPDIQCNERDRYIGQLLAVLLDDLYHTLSEIVAECYEDPAPEGGPDECDRDKMRHRHTKNTSRDRDEMTHYREESSDEGVDPIILQEEIFGSLVLLWSDEDIFAIFREKYLAEPLPEDEIVE